LAGVRHVWRNRWWTFRFDPRCTSLARVGLVLEGR
jgi:hypothetical protein